MTSRDLSAEAARLLKQAMRDVQPPEPASREQELATILALSEAIRNSARLRSTRRARVIAAALAATVLLGAGGWWAKGRVARHTGGASPPAWAATGRGELRASGVDVSLSGERRKVEEGARLVAGAAEAIHLESLTGTRMALHGDMVVVEQGPRSVFQLSRGTVSAKVAKLQSDERFLVRTSDVEIEVRGTAFDVSLAAASRCGTTTRVEVAEGLVAVRHGGRETLLGPGDVWPRCEEARADPPVAVPSPDDKGARAQIQAAPTSGLPRVASTAPVAGPAIEPTAAATLAATTLAAQNDLFQEAMGHKRQGHAGLAVTRLERLIAEYPTGPLRESATVERMKLLDAMDHPAGRRSAQEYLGQWPTGFAQAEAKRILARP